MCTHKTNRHTHTLTHACACTRKHIHTLTHIHTRTHAHMHTHTHTHTCTHHTHTCAHTRTHTHTHTQSMKCLDARQYKLLQNINTMITYYITVSDTHMYGSIIHVLTLHDIVCMLTDSVSSWTFFENRCTANERCVSDRCDLT